MLDRVEERRTPIGPRRKLGIERVTRPPDAFDELAEVLPVRPRHVLGITELLDEVLPGTVVELPAIQRLQRELARHGALIGERTGRGLGRHRRVLAALRAQAERRAMSPAISSAAAMDSAPLLSPVVAARSRACSTVLTVRTPKMTGTPVSRLASCSPRAHSPETYSKCGVSPRMTQPRATTASYRPDSASLRAATGSSNAPGTRAMSRSSAGPPRSSQAAVAPLRRLATMKSLNLAATMATLRPRATISPSKTRGALNCPLQRSCRFPGRIRKCHVSASAPTALAC